MLGTVTRLLLLAIHLHAVSLAQATEQQPMAVVEVHASTGQQLADAVAEWGATGSNMTIFIDVPYISMANVSFTSYASIAARSSIKPFSQGLLTVTGQVPSDPTQPSTILDTAMRSGLFPVPLTYPARYSLENLVLVNLCEAQYGVFLPDGRTTPPTPFGVELFGLTTTYQSQRLVNLAMYGTQAAVAYAAHRITLEQSYGIPQLQNVNAPYILGSMQPALEIDAQLSSSTQLFIRFLPLGLSVYINMAYRSYAAANDPVLLNLATQGRLMPPQFCNGSLMSAGFDSPDFRAAEAPGWMAGGQIDFLQGLAKATRQTTLPSNAKGPPPVLLLFSDTYQLPVDVTYTVGSTMLISGLNGPSEQPCVSAKQHAGVFRLSDGAMLVINRMELINLPCQVPTQFPPNLSRDNLLPSVFPLATFTSVQGPDTWHNQSSLVMHNTTLVIPPDDYLAFLYLAAKQAGQDASSCADAATIQRAAQLQAGFSGVQFSVPNVSALLQPPLFVDILQGWGLNASLIMLKPTSPVQLPHCSSNRPSGQRIALVVGVTVSIPALAALIGLGWLWLTRHQVRHRQPSSAMKPEERESIDTGRDQDQHTIQSSTVSASSHTVVGRQAEERDIAVPASSTTPCSVLYSSMQAAWQRQRELLHSIGDGAPDGAVPGVWCESGVSRCSELRSGLVGASRISVAHHSDRDDFSSRVAAVQDARLSASQPLPAAIPGGSAAIPGGSAAIPGGGSALPASNASVRQTAYTINLQTSNAMIRQVQQLTEQLSKSEHNEVRLAGVLGTGSSGTVFMGLWKNMQVAVKTMLVYDMLPARDQHGNVGKSPTALMEAAIAASVGHPNVVCAYHYDIKPLHDLPSDEGGLQIDTAGPERQPPAAGYKLFLLQELCNMSLAAAIDSRLFSFLGSSRLDMDGLVSVLVDVARGLAYLHSKGIIHGDLKPENILLKLDDGAVEGVTAKVTDFGLSRKLAPDATHVSNWSFGSPFYIAPEVIHNHQLSPASDMFSFGVVMWALYMQHPPYVCTTSGMYVWHSQFPSFHCKQPPPFELSSLFRRCYSANPRLRPTALEAAVVLGSLLDEVRQQPSCQAVIACAGPSSA